VDLLHTAVYSDLRPCFMSTKNTGTSYWARTAARHSWAGCSLAWLSARLQVLSERCTRICLLPPDSKGVAGRQRA